MGFRYIEADRSRPSTAVAPHTEGDGNAEHGADGNFADGHESQHHQVVLELAPEDTVLPFELELHPFLDGQLHVDVRFTVCQSNGGLEKKDFLAHRIVLALNSLPLAQLFTCEMRTPGDADHIDVQTVYIECAEPEIFELLLRFLYWQEIEITPNNVLPLMDMAERFEVHGLLQKCSTCLEAQCGQIDGVTHILNVAMRYKCQAVVDKCCATVLTRGAEAFFGGREGEQPYLNFDHDVMIELLKSDEWSIDEDGIFDVCLSWAKHHCPPQVPHIDVNGVEVPSSTSIADVLSPFMPHLRFPHMSTEKLFWAKRRKYAPEPPVIDALFFKLGQYDPAFLDSTSCRRRNSHVHFASTQGYEIIHDSLTTRVRLRRADARGLASGSEARGGACHTMRATRRMTRGSAYELSFRVLSNPRDVLFGVIEADDMSQIAHESSGRMIGCHLQKRRHRGSFYSRLAGEFDIDVHDAVTVRADLTSEGRLFYSVNGRGMELAFDNLLLDGAWRSPKQDKSIGAREFVFCFDMYTEGTEVEIL